MTIAMGFAFAISTVLPVIASAQNANDSADAHIAVAKAAAGDDFQNLFQWERLLAANGIRPAPARTGHARNLVHLLARAAGETDLASATPLALVTSV